MKYILLLFLLLSSCADVPDVGSSYQIKIEWVGATTGGYNINRIETKEAICYTVSHSGFQCKWKDK